MMKKFLTNFFICLAILTVLNCVFNFIIRKYYYADYSKVNLKSETFLLADSHGKALGDIMEDKAVCNFSAVSDSYFDIYRKIEFLIKNSKVKRIIITVDDHTLSAYREAANNLDRSVIFTTPGDFNSYLDFIIERYIKRYVAFCNAKSRDILKAFFISKLKREKNEKKEWGEISEEKRARLAGKRAATQFPNSVQSRSLIAELEKIIALCRSNNIRLTGIKFPISGEYYSLIEGKSYGADSLFRKYNLPVSDFSAMFKNNDDYFIDQDHLNKTGSRIFCDTLLKRIQ